MRTAITQKGSQDHFFPEQKIHVPRPPTSQDHPAPAFASQNHASPIWLMEIRLHSKIRVLGELLKGGSEHVPVTECWFWQAQTKSCLVPHWAAALQSGGLPPDGCRCLWMGTSWLMFSCLGYMQIKPFASWFLLTESGFASFTLGILKGGF